MSKSMTLNQKNTHKNDSQKKMFIAREMRKLEKTLATQQEGTLNVINNAFHTL